MFPSLTVPSLRSRLMSSTAALVSESPTNMFCGAVVMAESLAEPAATRSERDQRVPP